MYRKILFYKYVQNSTQMLPSDSVEYRCRFCGEEKTKKEFRKKAHAVAECVGNKSLVTKYECDKCNEHFAKGEESELGKLLQEFKATHSLKGKGGTTKVHGAEFAWSEEARTFSANINLRKAGYDMAALNIGDGNTAEFVLCRNIMVNFRLVYGALVKFALSVVSEEISKELSRGYSLLYHREDFLNYTGFLAISNQAIAAPEISVYKSDDYAEIKYIAAIDMYGFKYIIPLEFEKKVELSIATIIPFIDFSNMGDFQVFPFDYSNNAKALQQITHVTGKISKWGIAENK